MTPAHCGDQSAVGKSCWLTACALTKRTPCFAWWTFAWGVSDNTEVHVRQAIVRKQIEDNRQFNARWAILRGGQPLNYWAKPKFKIANPVKIT